MAIYNQIKPDGRSLAIELASKALRSARSAATARPGSVYIPNGDGTGTLIGGEAAGGGGFAPFVGDTTPPGRPTGISCSSAWGTLYVSWDGTLEGGVPADFAYVSVLVDGVEVERLTGAGTAVREDLENGATVQVTAVAYDAARDRNGNPAPNASEAFGPVSVQISDERAEIDAEVEEIKGEMEQAAQDAADAKEAAAEASSKADAAADKADSYQSQIDDVTATVNGVEQEVAGFSSQIQGAVEDASQALTSATEASQDLAGFKTTVSQTYETKADADAAMAQEVLDRNSAIEQSAGEILSTVSQNYVDNETGETLATKAEVSQTASQIKQEVSEEYQVKGDYLTEDEAASSYASKSELTQTADSIKAEVAQDYQTKAGMSAYATNSSVEQTASEIESNVAATYQTKAGMSAYATKSSVTQTANSIKSEVAATYTTKTEFEGLEIGGRNLLRWHDIKNNGGTTSGSGTDDFTGYYWASSAMSNAVAIDVLEPSTQYTISFTVEIVDISDAAEGVTSPYDSQTGFVFYSPSTSANTRNARFANFGSSKTIGETRSVSGTITTPSEIPSDYRILMYTRMWKAGTTTDTFRFTNVKIEKGNKATDWSPAPEDMATTDYVQTTYATKTALEQTENSITASVKAKYLSKTDASSTYATKTQLEQTEDSITTTVSQVQTIADNAFAKASQVEQTAEGLQVTLTETKATADNALSKAAAAAKTATNYLKFDSSGLCVGNMTGTLGYNTLIKSTGVDIRNGSTVLASFTPTQVDLGKNSSTSKISMANGNGLVTFGEYGEKYMQIRSKLGGININADPNSEIGRPSIALTSTWAGAEGINIKGGAGINFNALNYTYIFENQTQYPKVLADIVTGSFKSGEWTAMDFASGVRIAWLVHGGWGFKANAQTYTDFTLPWTAHNANYAVFYGLTNFTSGSQPAGFTGAHFITTNATTTKFRANCWNDSNSAFTCGVAIMVLDRPWG